MQLSKGQLVIYKLLDKHSEEMNSALSDWLDQVDFPDKPAGQMMSILGNMHRKQYEMLADIVKNFENKHQN